MKLHLHGDDGQEIPFHDSMFRLEEFRTYRLTVSSEVGPLEVYLGERRLMGEPGDGAFLIVIDHWVGEQVLRVHATTGVQHFPVQVIPRREKFSESTWRELLEDLERWMPGITTGLEGGMAHTVTHDGGRAPLLALSLLPLIPALVSAIRRVIRAPRQHVESYSDDVPMHMVRRSDRETLSWLTRHPVTARAVNRWYMPTQSGRELTFPQRLSRDTHDHPANRYIAWLVQRVSRLLNSLAETLARVADHRDGLQDTAQWCRARADEARKGAALLELLLQRRFFRDLDPQPASEAALVTVRNDPTYACVHRLARRFLAASLSLETVAERLPAPVRPSFDLYELWTFLALKQQLEAAYPSAEWRWKPSPAPELYGGFGAKSRFTGVIPGRGTLELTFNLTFSGWLATQHRPSASRWSISRERRPDLVLTWKGEDSTTGWVCFDAKYRVCSQALADAFSSLHLYRDSLHWPTFGGLCRGGLLLVPAQDEACTPWFEQRFLDQFGVGIVTMAPGEPLPTWFFSWLERMLGMQGKGGDWGSRVNPREGDRD